MPMRHATCTQATPQKSCRSACHTARVILPDMVKTLVRCSSGFFGYKAGNCRAPAPLPTVEAQRKHRPSQVVQEHKVKMGVAIEIKRGPHASLRSICLHHAHTHASSHGALNRVVGGRKGWLAKQDMDEETRTSHVHSKLQVTDGSYPGEKGANQPTVLLLVWAQMGMHRDNETLRCVCSTLQTAPYHIAAQAPVLLGLSMRYTSHRLSSPSSLKALRPRQFVELADCISSRCLLTGWTLKTVEISAVGLAHWLEC